MNVISNIDKIEKFYANSDNHDVKHRVVYADENRQLYVDKDLTMPVDEQLFPQLFMDGVVVINPDGVFERANRLWHRDSFADGYIAYYLEAYSNTYCGYDAKHGYWQQVD